MKGIFPKTLFVSFLIAVVNIANSQSISASYSIQKQITHNESGQIHNVATLNYSGFFFASGNKFISFKKPLYLKTYPEGFVPFQSENSTTNIMLPMDSVQGIHYMDLDSLIFRYRIDLSGPTDNSTLSFERSFPRGFQEWEFFADKKDINGLQCQKAIRYAKDGKPNWEVWFCPDIPSPGGPGGITDLPGLVVEAYCFPWQEKYILEAYNLSEPVAEEVFWPAEFKTGFKKLPPIRKPTPVNNQ